MPLEFEIDNFPFMSAMYSRQFTGTRQNQIDRHPFSTTLLGLMGINSGTYIGFKFPKEK